MLCDRMKVSGLLITYSSCGLIDDVRVLNFVAEFYFGIIVLSGC